MFTVVADAGCRNTVYIAVSQSGAEYVPQIRALGLRRFRVELLRETADQVGPLLDAYRQVIAGADDGRNTWNRRPLSSRISRLCRLGDEGGPLLRGCTWKSHTMIAAAPSLAGRPATEGKTVSHQQKRHERHEHDRKAKQARQRQSEASFNTPGKPLVGPRWFLIAGAGLCGLALVFWAMVTWL
jgi:collagenase-like PrtC family protease